MIGNTDTNYYPHDFDERPIFFDDIPDVECDFCNHVDLLEGGLCEKCRDKVGFWVADFDDVACIVEVRIDEEDGNGLLIYRTGTCTESCESEFEYIKKIDVNEILKQFLS